MPRSASQLRSWQLDRAWRLTTEVARTNPFYAERLGELPSERSEAAFRSLPVTTKAHVVEDCGASPPYGRRTTLSPTEIRHVVETSGTSGRGREVYALDGDEEQAVFRAAAVGFWWAGVRAGTPVLLTLPVAMSAAGLWYHGALRLLDANVLSVGAYPTERKVAALRRYAPDVIVGTPSYIGRLAAFCRDRGVDPAAAGVSSIVVAGEPYGIAWATETERAWNATLYEQYGSTERTMAWSCPGGSVRDGRLGTLHFPPELCFWEVVDPETGEATEPGDFGELVCTPLAAAGSPLLRFATSDRVRLIGAGECECRRPLAGIRAGSVERYDDMMKIRGVNAWPAAFDAAIFDVPGVIDYRGTVTRGRDGESVELQVECEPGAASSALACVKEAIRNEIGLNATVNEVDPGSLSREVPEGFVKVSRWEDRRR